MYFKGCMSFLWGRPVLFNQDDLIALRTQEREGNVSSMQNGFVLEIVHNGTLPKDSCIVVKFEEFS